MAERAHPEDPAFQGTRYEDALRERYRFCSKHIAGKVVLDVPCGTGWGTSLLQGAASLSGLDIDAVSIAYARNTFPGIDFQQGSMTHMPYKDASFDVVLCVEGIEHVFLSEASVFLSEAYRVLKPAGLIVVTVPLLDNGKHSLNQFHMFEYREETFENLIGQYFERVAFEAFPGPDGPEVRYIGRRRPLPLASAATLWTESSIHEKAFCWLVSVETCDGFLFSEGSRASLLSSCFAILTLEGLGRLHPSDPVHIKNRQACIERIIGSQDPSTGLFRDALALQYPVTSSTHNQEYLSLQWTYFALQTLDALGTKPAYPLLFLERYFGDGTIEDWLDNLQWDNPCLESNRVMFVLASAVHAAESDGDGRGCQLVHRALDWLDGHQEAETSLWGTSQGASLLNAVAGAYHFIPFYEYLFRPFCGWNRLIDQVLSLQQEDGLFAPQQGGGACEDLDAIDVLATATKYSSHRRRDIKRALVRAFWAIWNMHRPNGAFPYSDRKDDQTYRFSDWVAMQAGVGLGDTWATWFRLAALHTIGDLFPADLPALGTWTYRRRPALGYHRFTSELAAEDGTSLKKWLRLPHEIETKASRPALPVSIVIPCHNLGRYLPEALHSVMVQSSRAQEIIVVDDGSTDDFTRLYLQELDHSQVRIVRQDNLGVGCARNAGIKEAKGPYICCLDADDRMKPDFLRDTCAVLDSEPTTGFVSTWYECFDNSNENWSYAAIELPEMLYGNNALVSSVFRKSGWEKSGGYAEDWEGLQDWDFWIGLLETGYKGFLIHRFLFEYRVRADSMYSATSKPENFGRLYARIVKKHEGSFKAQLAPVLEALMMQLQQARQAAERSRALENEVERTRETIEELRASMVDRTQELIAKDANIAEQNVTIEELRASIADGTQELVAKDANIAEQNVTIEELRASIADGTQGLVAKDAIIAEQKGKLDALWEARDYFLKQLAAKDAIISGGMSGWRRLRNTVLNEGWSVRKVFKIIYLTAAMVAPRFLKKRLGPMVQRAKHRVNMALEPKPTTETVKQKKWPEDRPLISVVIPCCNYGLYVEEAVDSVLSQTFKDFEIIVVDGGSTDPDTLSTLRSLRKPRCTVYFREGQHLVGDNRNFGIARAQGKYICCLDADDKLKATYLEKALFLLETYHYDIVSTSVQMFGDSSELFAIAPRPSLDQLVAANQVSTVAVFSRELWERANGYHDFGIGKEHVAEDWDLWVRMMALGARAINIPELLMLYRVHNSSSLSRQADVPPLETQGQAIRRHNEAYLTRQNYLLSKNRNAAVVQVKDPYVNLLASYDKQAKRPSVLLALPFVIVGGADTVLLEVADQLATDGFGLCVVTTLASDESFGDNSLRYEAITRQIYHLHKFLPDKAKWRDFLFHLIESRGIDILFLAGSEYVYNLLPEIKQRFPKIKVVDQLFNEFGHIENNRRFASYIDANVVATEAVKRALIDRFGETEGRIRVIIHGVDVEGDFNPSMIEEGDLFASGVVPRDKFLVSFIGRFSEEKCPEAFVEIAYSLRKESNLHFVMIGNGPEYPRIKHRIKQLGMESLVYAPGIVPDIRPFLKASAVLVIPSRIEGIPIVLMESLAMGVPVVASSVGGMPSVLRDGYNGFLCHPSDTEAFGENIRGLAADEGLLNTLKANARKYAVEHLSVKKMRSSYRSFFLELLAAEQVHVPGSANPESIEDVPSARSQFAKRHSRGD